MTMDPPELRRRLLGSGRSPVVHFELPAKDVGRVRAFYERAFGWETMSMGPEAGGFALALTTDSSDKRIPTTVGAINGGFFERSAPEQQVKLSILVADIREAMKQVEAAGGRVLGGGQRPGEPDEMPGVGLFADFIDTEGNRMTLYEDRAT